MYLGVQFTNDKAAKLNFNVHNMDFSFKILLLVKKILYWVNKNTLVFRIYIFIYSENYMMGQESTLGYNNTRQSVHSVLAYKNNRLYYRVQTCTLGEK